MRLFAIAGVMVNVGENVARFFVGAFLKTGSNAVILRLSCLYYTDKLLLSLGSEPGPVGVGGSPRQAGGEASARSVEALSGGKSSVTVRQISSRLIRSY
jgi:hypothetical protein